MKPRVLATLGAIKEGRALKFIFTQDGVKREGFLVMYKGEPRAYENACRHIPISLDYGDGEFFSRDGSHIECQTHSAIYDPATGQCLAGPCVGASLKAIRLRVQEGAILLDQEEEQTQAAK